MSDIERRLAAIMFTDMVGYTALGQRDEALSLALVDEQRKLVRPILARHNGREIKTIGDAFLVEFHSALDAVRCAYDIQRAAREFNISMPSEKRIRLRIGVHLGDVVESRGDISGDAVNVASRIEPLAEDGGVCLSRQVYDHVQNKFELPLSNLGPKTLKNVGLPLEVYKMVMPWEETKPTGQRTLDKRRLAVLPFTNISPDPADEYFADGMTEELISKLSEIEGLRVIARTSVMNYKKKEKRISEIGGELGVGSVIEGSVRKGGNRIRITVQLIDASDEGHMWASNYDRELDDIFAIQSDVASKVAESLSAKVFAKKEEQDTADVEAYTMYMKGLQLFHQGTEPSLRESLALFESVAAKDPNFVRAYVGMVHTLGALMSDGYIDFVGAVGRAEVLARKAVELGPNSADAHAAMALVHSWSDRFRETAEESEKAISLNPNLSEAYISLGLASSSLGTLDQSLAAFRKANELDPLSWRYGHLLALVSLSSGRQEEAIALLERLRTLNPNNTLVYVGLAEGYMIKRDFTKAEEFLKAADEMNPREPLLELNRGIFCALTGKKEQAEVSLRKVLLDKSESVRLYGQLFINSALGNFDEAFAALDRMAVTHSWPFLIKFLPIFEELRKDRRFFDFSQKVGIASD